MNPHEVELINMYPDVMTAKMIAQVLGVGYAKALKLLKYGDVPCIRVGNTFRVSKVKFIEWLNDNKKREYLIE